MINFGQFRASIGATVILLATAASAWGASSRQVWLYDFIDRQSEAQIIRQTQTEFRPVTCDQVEKEAIYQPAGIRGDDLVEVSYPSVPIPEKVKGVHAIYLHFFTGIEDGDDFNTEPDVDGCRFIIRINGRRAFSTRHRRQRWTEHQLDLSHYAGKEVNISFLIDPLRSSTADWAAWGRPRLYVEGNGQFIDELAVELGQAQTPNHPTALKGPQQITRVDKDDKSVTLVAVQDAALDPDTLLLNDKSSNGQSPKIMPRFVAGQNADPDSFTIVRILNEDGIDQMQFLAFPIIVTGGVQVEAAYDNLGYQRIITAPLTDRETCYLRIFNEHGGFVRDIPVSSDLSAPFVIDVGQYDPVRPGEEIAVISRNQKAGCDMKIMFYGIDGAYLSCRNLPVKEDTPATLIAQHGEPTDTLHIYLEKTKQLYSTDTIEGPLTPTENANPDLVEGLNPKASLHVVPFEKAIDVKHLSTHGVISENARDYRIGPLHNLTAGTVIEVSFKAKTDSDGQIIFCIYQGRTLLDGLRQVFYPPVDQWKYYRFIFRIQKSADNMTLRLQTEEKIQLEEFDANQQTELEYLNTNHPVIFDDMQ